MMIPASRCTYSSALGVEYSAHVLESILKYVAPGLGWR
jgi:hypothetical protein